MRHLFVLPLASAFLALPLAAQQFTIDGSALPAQSLWTDGVELVDVDNDGDVDILFANGSVYGGNGTQGSLPQHLFLNDGAGNFSAAHGNLNVSNFNAKMVIAEDFDNDGDMDLYYCSGSAGSRPRLLINQGGTQGGTTGIFADMTVANTPSLSLRSFGIAAGDIDDDGDMDVAISDGGTFGGQVSQLRLLENDGNAVFTEITNQLPVDLYNCQDITMFDYDGDFDIDIALAGKGSNGKRGRLYLNDGTGNFSISNAMNGLGSGATYEIEWGDLDGDGDFDAAVQSISGTNEGWARNDGPTTTLPEFTFPTPNGSDDNELAMLDYDNDGDLDVFVGSLGSTEKIYRNDGGGTYVNQQGQIANANDPTLDMGFADLDGDGDYDMVTAQGEGGVRTNLVYVNGGGADTLAPTLLGSEAVTRLGATDTVLHVRVADAISEDGHINATVSAAWSTDLGSGSVDATHMGGSLFRAAIPTAGASELSVTWTATDVQGNSADFDVASAYAFVGPGTAGIAGVPKLTMSGSFEVGEPVALNLVNGAPSAIAAMFVATSSTPVSFKGGTLYPFPIDVSLAFLTLPGSGNLALTTAWPSGLPSGFELFFQFAMADASVPVAGASLSNAIMVTQP
ncbi:MAG: hypothetical protein DHS20C15_02780 [Planctomycetota bacterium]|nr:MAG: hypothetical protein DHS20C15_02780 [Planctomycetota bacterium]